MMEPVTLLIYLLIACVVFVIIRYVLQLADTTPTISNAILLLVIVLILVWFLSKAGIFQ